MVVCVILKVALKKKTYYYIFLHNYFSIKYIGMASVQIDFTQIKTVKILKLVIYSLYCKQQVT